MNEQLNGWNGVNVITDTVGPSNTNRLQLVNANADPTFVSHVERHFRPKNSNYLCDPDKSNLPPHSCPAPDSKSFFYDWLSTELVKLIRFCISQSTNICEHATVLSYDPSHILSYRFEFNYELHAAIGWDVSGNPHCHGIKIIVDHFLPTAQHPNYLTRLVTAYPINIDDQYYYNQYYNPFVILEPKAPSLSYNPSPQDGNGWSDDEWQT